MRRRRRLQAIFPAGRRLACAVPLLRRQRHAPGEHDRGGRASGADRSRDDPAGDRRGAQNRGDRSAGLRGCDGDRRQLGHDGRPAARLCALAGKQGLRDGRDDLRLDVAHGARVEQHQFRHHAAREDEGDRRPPIRTCRMSTAATPSSATISTTSSRASRTTPSSCCRRAGTPSRAGCSTALPACRSARSFARRASTTCCCSG